MGLIGNLLQPLFVGFPAPLFSPVAFLRRALRAGSGHHRLPGDHLGCAELRLRPLRRVGQRGAEGGLDLSSWAVAFNGAEPVRADTLDRFPAAFAAAAASGAGLLPLLRPGRIDALRLRRAARRPRPSRGSGGGSPAGPTLVSCGPLAVARGSSSWTPRRGPGPAGGWASCGCRRPAWRGVLGPSRGDRGHLRGSPRRHRRGAVPPHGRPGLPARRRTVHHRAGCKDIIIIRGRNLYPQDVEAAVARELPFLEANACAAFALEDEGEERLAVVVEADRHLVRRAGCASPAHREIDALVARVRQAVSDEFEVPSTPSPSCGRAGFPRNVERQGAAAGVPGGAARRARSTCVFAWQSNGSAQKPQPAPGGATRGRDAGLVHAVVGGAGRGPGWTRACSGWTATRRSTRWASIWSGGGDRPRGRKGAGPDGRARRPVRALHDQSARRPPCGSRPGSPLTDRRRGRRGDHGTA